MNATQELYDRITFHYNKNLDDAQIVTALRAEGYELKSRNLARIRQKLGMRRRSRFPEFREFSDEEDETNQGESSSQPRIPVTPKKPPKGIRKPSVNQALIPKVTAFVKEYMSKYDGSHDFNHIKRVVGLAHLIYKEVKAGGKDDADYLELDLNIITLAALLHDVGDKKYLEPGQDANTLVLATLLSFGVSP